MTTVKKSAFTKVLAMLLALIAISSAMIIPASAATSGSTNTRTIYVQTNADWRYPGSESITLKQNKCQYYYQTLKNWKWVTKTASMYPYYKVTITNNSTGSSTTKTWHSSSMKIKLNRNTSYTITVAYDSTGTWLGSNSKLNSWKTSPYWWVSATHKATAW